jgi:hypothetical protein
MGSEKCCQHPAGNSGGICGEQVLARQFCSAHYAAFRKACLENGSWSNRDEVPERPKWEYINDIGEAELMELNGKKR